MLTQLLTVLAMLSVALAAEWQMTDLRPVSVLTGVAATAPAECFGAATDDTYGAGVVHTTDSGSTSEFINGGAFNMDVSYTTTGVGCMVTLGGIYIAPDGRTFEAAKGLRGVSQNTEAFGTNSVAATGQFKLYNNLRQNLRHLGEDASTFANGVAVSTNAGADWQIYDIGLNSTAYVARYAAFPTDSTWYVSSGSWPYDDEVKVDHRLTAKLTLANKKLSFDSKPSALASGEDGSGYPGAISKTSDGGATWTQVFDSKGEFYFNEIHCFDAENCMAVAENAEAAYALSTQDGGATWKQVLQTDAGGSLMGCRMISATEAWVSGGGVDRVLTGFFYHTTDAGATWTMSELPQGYSMDLSFSQGVGYSAVLNQAYSTIAVYK